MSLASPQLTNLTAYEQSKATRRAAAEVVERSRLACDAANTEAEEEAAEHARRAQEAAATEDAEGEPAADEEEAAQTPKAAAAAEATAALEEAAAALAEAEAAEAEAAAAVDGADVQLLLALHVALLRVACRYELWDEVDMILPSAKSRVDVAPRRRAPREAAAAGGVVVLPGALPELTKSLPGPPLDGPPPDGPAVVTETQSVSFAAAESVLTLAHDGATLVTSGGGGLPPRPPSASTPEPPPATVEAQMWIDVTVLAGTREVDRADEAERYERMAFLASSLEQCERAPYLVEAAGTRTDLLADAAMRLWQLCVPAIKAADADACTQPAAAGATPLGSLALGSAAELRILLEPNTKSDQEKLVEALRSQQRTDANFTISVDVRRRSDGSTRRVVSVRGSGELHLQAACDSAGSTLRWSWCVDALSRSTSYRPPDFGDAGGSAARDGLTKLGSVSRMKPHQLVRLLQPVHWTLRRAGLADPMVRGLIALRLCNT